MKMQGAVLLLGAACVVAGASHAWGHGNIMVPPGGGGSTTTTSVGPPPNTGAGPIKSGGPPKTDGAKGGIAAPSGPSGPTSATSPGTRGGGQTSATTAGNQPMADSTPNPWEMWWEHNKDAFLLTPSDQRASGISGTSRALTSRGRSSAPSDQDAVVLRRQIVEGFQELLRTETESELCDSATLALARVATLDMASSVAPAIRLGLTHDVLSVQTSATLSLGVLGATQSLPLLNALMADTTAGRQAIGGGAVPWRTRAYAALALGLIGESLAVEPLFDVALHAPKSDRELRATATIALGLMLTDEDGRISRGLSEMLVNPALDSVVRSCAATSLSRIGDSTAMPVLLKVFRDQDSDQVVRQSIAQALGRLGRVGERETVAALTQSLSKDHDAPTRQFAWIALGRLLAKEGDEPLTDATRELVTLIRHGITDPEHKPDRAWAVLAAGLCGRASQEACTLLTDPLADMYAQLHDPSDKASCAVALGLCRAHAEADAMLADMQSSADPAFRGYAAVALGLMGHEPASQAILELCRNPGSSDVVRQQCGSAIALLRNPAAAPSLLAALSDSRSVEFAWSMSRALGQLRDLRTVGPLLAMAQDKERQVLARGFACVALGLIEDRAPIRFNTGLEEDYNYLAGVSTIDEVVGL